MTHNSSMQNINFMLDCVYKSVGPVTYRETTKTYRETTWPLIFSNCVKTVKTEILQWSATTTTISKTELLFKR
jgi:hypothetical protein